MKIKANDLSNLPESSGVYRFLNDEGTILYIGKAKNLKNRVSSYFQKSTDLEERKQQMVRLIDSIEITEVQSEFEALLLEARLIKEHQPKYNVIWKDDKHYIYIKVTGEEFPRIMFARKEDDPQADFYGPFPSKRIVREILYYIRSIFPYCTQNPSIKRPCFYTHIGLCNPCPAVIRRLHNEDYKRTRSIYIKNIRSIKLLLNGHLTTVSNELKNEMSDASERELFEVAAMYRDKLQKIEYLIKGYTPAEAYIENPQLAGETWIKEQIDLATSLQPYFPELKEIHKIECYDISNLSGKQATGSMVTFVDGKPEKNLYRRFKIKTLDTPNDFAMMQEMMSRRLKHTDWEYPDVFLIDGGKPQLLALKNVFDSMHVQTPMVGIAKRFEELVIPRDNGEFTKIRFSRSSDALHLMQRLRDEAHRFAKKYHKLLRIKNLLGDYKPRKGKLVSDE